MAIEFDPDENARNIDARGISFALAEDFAWGSAFVEPDRRRDYGEDRFVATGLIGDRLHVLVFTFRGADVRVISLRRADRRGQAVHGEKARSLPRR